MRHWRHHLASMAIPHLTLLLIIGQIIIFVAAQTPALALEDMALIPAKVLDGEIWRLVTFLFWPPASEPIWLLLAWYVFYLMGSALEQQWGRQRYNAYIFVAYIATLIAAFLQPQIATTNIFIGGSVFLAFAWLFPDFEFYLFFILPVKVKYLAMFTWMIYGFQFIVGPGMQRLVVIASISNFLLFFGRDIWRRLRQQQNQVRTSTERRSIEQQPRHRCRVCGITDQSDPQMQFRYCSKCVGTQGYCQQHLHNHEHVTAEADKPQQ